MKAVVAVFNQEKAFSVLAYEPSDGTFSSTTGHWIMVTMLQMLLVVVLVLQPGEVMCDV